MELTHCTIPVELSHLTAQERREAACWAVEKFGIADVDFLRPMTKKVVDGPNLCNEIMLVPCFWFSSQKDANWFLLRWAK
jgi:hypothetical protein